MKQFIAGILVGATLLGTAWAADTLYSLEPFSEAVSDAEVLACINAQGNGAMLYDLDLDGAGSYAATLTGYACVKEVK